MPHCIVEYSVGLDGTKLVCNVYSAVLASGLFNADGSDIKVRATSYNQYVLGGGCSSFAHVTIKLLSGRTAEQKESLAKGVLLRLTDLHMVNTEITVEICDIDRRSYQKALRAPL